MSIFIHFSGFRDRFGGGIRKWRKNRVRNDDSQRVQYIGDEQEKCVSLDRQLI